MTSSSGPWMRLFRRREPAACRPSTTHGAAGASPEEPSPHARASPASPPPALRRRFAGQDPIHSLAGETCTVAIVTAGGLDTERPTITSAGPAEGGSPDDRPPSSPPDQGPDACAVRRPPRR